METERRGGRRFGGKAAEVLQVKLLQRYYSELQHLTSLNTLWI